MIRLPRVYYISSSFSDLESSIEDIIKVLNFGIRLIQLRIKGKKENLLNVLSKVYKLCNHYNALLIVNDYILSESDGVHLGSDDIFRLKSACSSSLKNKVLGITIHDSEDFIKYLEYNPTYYGFGSYRESNTKQVKNIITKENFRKIAELSKKHKIPTFVIGGIRLKDFSLILNKFHGVAVSEALNNINVLSDSLYAQELKKWIN